MNAFKNVSYLWFLNAEVTDISKTPTSLNRHEASNQIMKWHSILLKLIVINQQINCHKKHILLIIWN